MVHGSPFLHRFIRQQLAHPRIHPTTPIRRVSVVPSPCLGPTVSISFLIHTHAICIYGPHLKGYLHLVPLK